MNARLAFTDATCYQYGLLNPVVGPTLPCIKGSSRPNSPSRYFWKGRQLGAALLRDRVGVAASVRGTWSRQTGFWGARFERVVP